MPGTSPTRRGALGALAGTIASTAFGRPALTNAAERGRRARDEVMTTDRAREIHRLLSETIDGLGDEPGWPTNLLGFRTALVAALSADTEPAAAAVVLKCFDRLAVRRLAGTDAAWILPDYWVGAARFDRGVRLVAGGSA